MKNSALLLLQGRFAWRFVVFCLSLSACCLIPALSSAQDTSHSPGWVVLSINDYRVLRIKAFPAEREPDPPPVDATLTRVDYDLRVSGELASGRASLTIDVLKDGWVRVAIPSGLFVREAKLDGKLVSLVAGTGEKAGQLNAMLSHPGRAILLLDIAVPVSSAAAEESISLPATASGVTRASVEVPRQGVDVRLTGGLISEHSESAANGKWVVYARGNEPLNFIWHRKMEDHRNEQPLRLRGSLTQVFGLGEDSTSVSAEANLEVTQGAAHEVKIQVPPQVTINQVLGATVSDWESKSGELTVTFLEPVEQNARFVLTGETRLSREGAMDIPLLHLLNVERETGGVAVEVLGAGEIKDVKTQGLENADASDLGDLVANRQSPSLLAFRVRPSGGNSARTLSVNVARCTQQAVLMANVEEARYRVLISKEGKTLVQAHYAVRNNQSNFVKITLPAGATLWSAALSSKPIRPGQAPDGSLLLPLEKTRGGEEAPAFAIEMVYLCPGAAWSDKGKIKLTLPALDLPVSRTGLLVYYPLTYKATAEPSVFRTETYRDPASPVLTAATAMEANEEIAFSMNGQRDESSHYAVDAASAPPPKPAMSGGVANLPQIGRSVQGLVKLTDKDAADEKNKQQATQVLVDKYRSTSEAGRVSGILPIRVSFPSFGPSLFLVSELTSENQAPSAELSYQQEKRKGGSK